MDLCNTWLRIFKRSSTFMLLIESLYLSFLNKCLLNSIGIAYVFSVSLYSIIVSYIFGMKWVSGMEPQYVTLLLWETRVRLTTVGTATFI
jgi:hypothetical protein